jgi:hypothetical protein
MDMNHSEPTFSNLKDIYTQYFSLGKIASNINEKFALISLIGYIVYNMKRKRPDVSYYEVVYKLSEGLGISDLEIKALAIIVEDFSYECTEFPTFGLKPKEMPEKIREILSKKMPF